MTRTAHGGMKKVETGSDARLEDAMRGFHTIHVPHFQHFSARSALDSAREKLSDHSIEITMALAILFGVLIVLTFWAVVAR